MWLLLRRWLVMGIDICMDMVHECGDGGKGGGGVTRVVWWVLHEQCGGHDTGCEMGDTSDVVGYQSCVMGTTRVCVVSLCQEFGSGVSETSW